MSLLKPTKRDIVKAATDEVRASIYRDSQQRQAESSDKRQQAEQLRSDAAARVASRQVSKLQPLADQLNAVTEKAGFGSPFKVTTTYEGTSRKPGAAVIVQLNYDYQAVRVTTRAKYPEDSERITALLADAQADQSESNRLREIAHNLEDRDVLSGSINAALNGEASAALQTLVDNIKEVALNKANELGYATRRY